MDRKRSVNMIGSTKISPGSGVAIEVTGTQKAQADRSPMENPRRLEVFPDTLRECLLSGL